MRLPSGSLRAGRHAQRPTTTGRAWTRAHRRSPRRFGLRGHLPHLVHGLGESQSRGPCSGRGQGYGLGNSARSRGASRGTSSPLVLHNVFHTWRDCGRSLLPYPYPRTDFRLPRFQSGEEVLVGLEPDEPGEWRVVSYMTGDPSGCVDAAVRVAGRRLEAACPDHPVMTDAYSCQWGSKTLPLRGFSEWIQGRRRYFSRKKPWQRRDWVTRCHCYRGGSDRCSRFPLRSHPQDEAPERHPEPIPAVP